MANTIKAHITTLPVYSKLANSETIPVEVSDKLPAGWRLSQHQVDTYRALVNQQAEVIFNIAMTGDGKSLAGQLPTLLQGWRWPLMAMYPTNELIADQEHQLAGALERWESSAKPGSLNRDQLDRIIDEESQRHRGDALLRILRNNSIVLTNPDIYHLVMEQFYVQQDDAPDKIVGPMIQRYRQFTFDEFHIFETPQVISVINAMLFTHQLSSSARPHAFLFLSATPGNLMVEYLKRSGLSVCEVQGEYLHTEALPDPDKWRRILNRSIIHFDTSSAESWVEQHLEDVLLPFFKERGAGAKGAIIVNSVASAHRLLPRLRQALAPYGLSVETNTGLTARSRRVASYAADLLIGTSTVDVGVDFQINFLVFESRDAGSFLQRLGRLGRHSSYQRDGKEYAFQDYVAYALVPEWISEALFVGRDGEAPLLETEAITNREQLAGSIETAYPIPASYQAYAQMWGKFQSMRILKGLTKATIREQQADVKSRLEKCFEDTFQVRLRAAIPEYNELMTTRKVVLEEAISFRGGSYFECGLIDQSEAEKPHFQTADLFMLLPNARLEYVSEDDFYTQIQKAGSKANIFRRKLPVVFFYLSGWQDERQKYQVYLHQRLMEWDANYFGRVQALTGIQIDANVPGLNELNRRLLQRKIPALLCASHTPIDLKRRLRLPMLFALYPYESLDGEAGSIAFGRQALMLEARLKYASINCAGNKAIIC